jgi:hypothetical protein
VTRLRTSAPPHPALHHIHGVALNSGRDAIRASFATYFASLRAINETITGPMIANGNWGGFPKRVHAVSATTGEPSQYDVVNWFVMNCSTGLPLIARFSALFNATR